MDAGTAAVAPQNASMGLTKPIRHYARARAGVPGVHCGLPGGGSLAPDTDHPYSPDARSGGVAPQHTSVRALSVSHNPKARSAGVLSGDACKPRGGGLPPHAAPAAVAPQHTGGARAL